MSVHVTVHTPCLNGAPTLHRVYESLRAQSARDFEWLVIDDGSTDDSASVVEGFAREADFDVRLHRFPERRGKPAADNQGVRMARGQFFVTADADDQFAPHALATFLARWESIPQEQRHRFAGVTARVQDQQGRAVGPPFPRDPFDVSLTDLYHRHKHRAEKWNFVRRDVMAEHPFPEVDFYVPESVVWHAIGMRYLTRCTNDILRTYFIGTPSSVSGTPVLRYSRGFAYALERRLNDRLAYAWRDPVAFLRTFIHYGRYSRHAQTSFRASRQSLTRLSARLLYTLTYPVSSAIVAKDRRRGAAP